MILICSAGHIYNTESIQDRWWKGDRCEGGKCPEVLAYDVMATPKTKKCNRKLKKLDSLVKDLCDKLFTKYYSPNNEVWNDEFSIAEVKTLNEAEKVIKQLLIDGYIVKAGYTTTSISHFYERYIFYKKLN